MKIAARITNESLTYVEPAIIDVDEVYMVAQETCQGGDILRLSYRTDGALGRTLHDPEGTTLKKLQTGLQLLPVTLAEKKKQVFINPALATEIHPGNFSGDIRFGSNRGVVVDGPSLAGVVEYLNLTQDLADITTGPELAI